MGPYCMERRANSCVVNYSNDIIIIMCMYIIMIIIFGLCI